MSDELGEILAELREIRTENRDIRDRVIVLDEKIKMTVDHETRIRHLETWRWVTSGSIFMGASSLVTAIFQAKGGA